MEDFSINEMQKMQRDLQEKYKDKWEPIGPETGKNKLLWMVGEIGEVIDIVKKNGGIKGRIFLKEMKQDSSTIAWNAMGDEWFELAQTGEARNCFIMPNMLKFKKYGIKPTNFQS